MNIIFYLLDRTDVYDRFYNKPIENNKTSFLEFLTFY